MAISNFGELRQAVRDWLSRQSTSDITDAQINTMISMAEDRIAETPELWTHTLETTEDLTVNGQRIAKPTGYLSTRRLYLDGDPVIPLTFLDPRNFFARFLATATAEPEAFTVEGSEIVFGPAPDTTYTGKHLFWKRLTAFSDDSDTNNLLTEHRGVYLYASLLEAAIFLEDDARALTFATLFDDQVDRVEKSDRRESFPSGFAVAQSVGVTVA